ncbi:MAG TPA: tetratricopeptide repeat protein [Candidatus Krumholzibacteria bacterium]|nr:tetratricopeptide repeat protein [Candidatus Krumholzibacteria bacterium]
MFLIAIVLLALACLVVHMTASRPSLGWMWGAHFYGFFPRAILYVATLLLAASMALLVSGYGDRATARVARMLSGRRFYITAGALVAAGTACFWIFRICHTYLGDGNVIVTEIDTKQEVLPREPLTSLLQYVVYGITKPWFYAPERDIRDVAQDAVAVGSVAAGFLFLVVLWFLADELARLRPNTETDTTRRPVTLLVWLCLAAQGYMQLFFGYVENYSFYAVGIVVFLWLSLRCLRGACGLWLPLAALALCFALHLSSTVLVPPFLAVAVIVLKDPARRNGALRDLSTGVVAVAAANVWLSHRGYNPLSTVLSMIHTAFTDQRTHGYMFSSPHYRDFFNEQILIGPLGLFLFLAAAVTVWRTRITGSTAFLLIGGIVFAGACWMIGDSNLGYARDWDLLSHAGIVLTVAGLGIFIARPAKAGTLTVCISVALLMSLYHSVPWFITNTREGPSLARLQTLPLGLGRTEVLIAGWYERHGDLVNERKWLERSIAAYSGNPNSFYKLGVMELNEHRYANAAVCFENSVRCRPQHFSYRAVLVRTYFMAAMPAKAVPHLEQMAKQSPNNLTITLYLGEARYQSGDTTMARVTFAQVRDTCRLMMQNQPVTGPLWSTYGWALFRLGEVQESRTVLAEAIAADPKSQEAECYLGCVLRSAGALDDARAHFMRCAAIRPELPAEIPDRDAIIAWIAAPDAPAPAPVH